MDHARFFADHVSNNTHGDFTIRISDLSMQPTGDHSSREPPNLFSFYLQDMYQVPDEVIGHHEIPFPVFEADYGELYKWYNEWKTEFRSSKKSPIIDILYVVPEKTNYFATNRHINSIKDLRGLKISTFSKNSASLFALLDMNPSIVPRVEVSQLLQQGNIDALAITPSLDIDMKFYKPFSYVYRTKPAWSFVATAIDRQFWESLPGNLKIAMQEGSEYMEARLWSEMEKTDNTYMTKLKQLGFDTQTIPASIWSDIEDKMREYEIRKCPPHCDVGGRGPICRKYPHLCVVRWQ